ncbi:MAG: 30S ribosomal protein S6 [Nitriliruptorales bacterium]|nr:30S ribosomal protein S6 [Nitriliruptorales bacterium]
MRRYEMMVILPGSLDDDEVEGVLQRIRDVVDQQEGRLVDEAFWGKREFAYEINKATHGYYAVFDLEMSLDGVTELERQLKLSDNVVRFKTVRPDLRVKQPS